MWPLTTQAAKIALAMRYVVKGHESRSSIDMFRRYRLLDYFYTAFHQASTDGTPVLYPLWFNYPQDSNTFPIDLQFFFGDSILVSPVTGANVTFVEIYLPDDIFYDFSTFEPVQGHGANITLTNVNFTTIPVHIRGGVVLPLRAEGTMTTTELRATDFQFVVAPGTNGSASGSLYIDDGVSIANTEVASVQMEFEKGRLTVDGTFVESTGVKVASAVFLNVDSKPSRVELNGSSVKDSQISFDSKTKVLTVTLGIDFDAGFTVSYS